MVGGSTLQVVCYKEQLEQVCQLFMQSRLYQRFWMYWHRLSRRRNVRNNWRDVRPNGINSWWWGISWRSMVEESIYGSLQLVSRCRGRWPIFRFYTSRVEAKSWLSMGDNLRKCMQGCIRTDARQLYPLSRRGFMQCAAYGITITRSAFAVSMTCQRFVEVIES